MGERIEYSYDDSPSSLISRRQFLLSLGGALFLGRSMPNGRTLEQELNPSQERKKVSIFAGHAEKPATPNDEQGPFSASGIPEYRFNDELVRHFEQLPLADSYSVTYARTNIPFTQRPTLAQKLGSEIYIEIHHDSAQKEDINRLKTGEQTEEKWRELSGFSVIYSPNNKYSRESLRLVQLVADELFQAGFKPNLYHAKDIPGERRPLADASRAIYTGGEYVLRENVMPAVLIEAGVIVNPFEEVIMKQPETQRKVVESIDRAVQKYFAEQRR